MGSASGTEWNKFFEHLTLLGFPLARLASFELFPISLIGTAKGLPVPAQCDRIGRMNKWRE